MRSCVNKDELIVALTRDKAEYPQSAPFHPDEHYPEYPFGPNNLSCNENSAYRAVRNCLIQLKLDEMNMGKSKWNPLGHLINPGDTVVLKPNFVLDKHNGGGSIYSIITHPSIIRAVADFCWIALCGAGRLIVADTPLDECDFDNLMKVTHLKEVSQFFDEQGKVKLDILDLRDFSAVPEKRLYAQHRKKLAGDPKGSIVVDLGNKSALFGKKSMFFGVDYNVAETRKNHHDSVHRYQISNTILSCDVLISIPKLKVHKLVGATLNLKGMVGIATNKNYLVHYSEGSKRTGGDQFVNSKRVSDNLILGVRQWLNRLLLGRHVPILEQFHSHLIHSKIIYAFYSILKRLGIAPKGEVDATNRGKWYGNDTCWRMVADLTRIVHYADEQGSLMPNIQRRLFSFVDGIIGGDYNGPLLPRARPEGFVACGHNMVAVDIACLCLIGFAPHKFPLYKYLIQDAEYDYKSFLESIVIQTDVAEMVRLLSCPEKNLGFEPHPNWKGHVEIDIE